MGNYNILLFLITSTPTILLLDELLNWNFIVMIALLNKLSVPMYSCQVNAQENKKINTPNRLQPSFRLLFGDKVSSLKPVFVPFEQLLENSYETAKKVHDAVLCDGVVDIVPTAEQETAIQKLRQTTRDLFEVPIDQLRRYTFPNEHTPNYGIPTPQVGYKDVHTTGLMATKGDSRAPSHQVFRVLPRASKEDNLFPSTTLNAYENSVAGYTVMEDIVKATMMALGKVRGWSTEQLDLLLRDPQGIRSKKGLRLIQMPSLTEVVKTPQVRLPSHKDKSLLAAVTVPMSERSLSEDELGLQIQRPDSHEWLQLRSGVKTKTGMDPLRFMPGRVLEQLTDKFFATPHRVMGTPAQMSKPRFSTAGFVPPNPDSPMRKLDDPTQWLLLQTKQQAEKGLWINTQQAMNSRLNGAQLTPDHIQEYLQNERQAQSDLRAYRNQHLALN